MTALEECVMLLVFCWALPFWTFDDVCRSQLCGSSFLLLCWQEASIFPAEVVGGVGNVSASATAAQEQELK